VETTSSGWTILDREAGVLTREYRFAGNATARTFVARMDDGTLLVTSPSIELSDEAAAELSDFGTIGAIVAPNGFHHLGHATWRKRFGDVPHYAPARALPRIARKNPNVGELLPLDRLAARLGDSIGIHEVDNTRCGESWTWVTTPTGRIYYTSDVLANIQTLPPALMGLVFRFTKSAPGYRPFHLALRFIVKDSKATLRALRDDIEARPLTVVVPGHGDVLAEHGLQARTVDMLQAAV